MNAQTHQSDPRILGRRTLERDHRYLAGLLHSGLFVLDVGCGTGAITAGIAKAVGPHGYAVGIDRDEGLLEIARKQHMTLSNLQFEAGNATTLNYRAQFDIVTAARTLQWISEPGLALLKMRAAAKTGGSLVVLDYDHAHNEWQPDPPAEFHHFYRIGVEIRTPLAHPGAMTRAFAYLRVSGRGQIEGDGFTRQLTKIKEYAAHQDLKIVKVFREEGVSGTTELENRPALVELLGALGASRTKLVLIERLDRLARDLMVQETIIGDLRQSGYQLVSVSEPDLLQDDPGRKLMRQIFGAIAEYEKAMIVAKLRGARQCRKAKVGRCEGRKPFGYFEGDRETLQRMQALRGEGLGFDRIAERLNTEGYKGRTGRRWHGMVGNRILSRSAA